MPVGFALPVLTQMLCDFMKKVRLLGAKHSFSAACVLGCCFPLQGMQNQLETLLSNAEQLATELSENINAAENGALLPLPRVTEERDASESVEESIRPAATLRGFDQRFVELLRKVNHRSAREEALQKKLMDMMKSISSMLEEPHVVQHEL